MRRDTMLLVSHSEIKIKTHFAYKAEKHIRAHRVRLRYILLRWKIFVIFSPLHLLVAYYTSSCPSPFCYTCFIYLFLAFTSLFIFEMKHFSRERTQCLLQKLFFFPLYLSLSVIIFISFFFGKFEWHFYLNLEQISR